MESTLYPKITNKLTDVRHTLVTSGKVAIKEGVASDKAPVYTPNSLEIVGTVKLHGTHADIVVHSDDSITFQSRNRETITKERDNCGFVTTMDEERTSIRTIRDRYHERFRKLNPEIPIDASKPLILAGEWIGKGIQKGVALVQLERKFVIVSAAINGSWLPDSEYADIYDEAHNLYHISRSGFYHATLLLNELQETMKVLDELTAKVEKECPFAATFDAKGMGEGIVWKFADYPNQPDTWFKVKGAEFTPTVKAPQDPLKAAEREAQKGKAGAFAERVVTDVRLEQAWDYLAEMDIKREVASVGEFLKWINNDVKIEEKTEIKERGIDVKILGMEIGKLAKPWYLARVLEEDLKKTTLG
jgi:hypothetical protein